MEIIRFHAFSWNTNIFGWYYSKLRALRKPWITNHLEIENKIDTIVTFEVNIRSMYGGDLKAYVI